MPEPIGEYTREGLVEIINALPMAILIFDRNRKILLGNRISKEFTGKDIEQIIGISAGDAFSCVHHDRKDKECGSSDQCASCSFSDALEQALENSTPRHMVETRKVLKNKGEKILRFSTRPLKLAGQDVALLSIEDLTRERTHEQIRLEKEKLATVLETTGGVCHELSQPLQVIMGYCEILGERKDLNSEISGGLKAIQREVAKLARLTHDLTNVTRYETKPYLKSQIIDIKKSAEE